MATSPSSPVLRSPQAQRSKDMKPASDSSESPQAIGLRRRESASFKTMSTGSLVSNSPFTRMQSTAQPQPSSNNPPSSKSAISAVRDLSSSSLLQPHSTLYGQSRVPTSATLSAPSTVRKVSNENEPSGQSTSLPSPVAVTPSGLSKGSPGKQVDVVTVKSGSPSTPFRPRTHSPSTAASMTVSYRDPSHANEFEPFKTLASPRRTVGSVHEQQQSPQPLSSSLSPSRRIKGPRGESTSPVVQNKSPSKNVTWAATEEVLEFEVEDDDRRESGSSSIASSNQSTDDDDEEEEEIIDSYPAGYESEEEEITFDDGGSLVLHNLSHDTIQGSDFASRFQDHEISSNDGTNDDTDCDSVTSSAVTGMIGEIDNFLKMQERERVGARGDAVAGGDVFSSPYKSSSKSTTDMFLHPAVASGTGRSKFSDNSDVASESSYGSEDDDDSQDSPATLHFGPTSALVSLTPKSSQSHIVPSSSEYSLPDLPMSSPFQAFVDNGESSSVVTLDLNGPNSNNNTITNINSHNNDEIDLSSFGLKTPVYTTHLSSSIASLSAPVQVHELQQSQSSIVQSREGSIVTPLSPVLSDTGSMSTVASSLTRFAMRSEQLASRLAANELLLSSGSITAPITVPSSPGLGENSTPTSGISAVARFPSPPGSGDVFSPLKPIPHPIPTPGKPAEKAVPATVNHGMLAASSGMKVKDAVLGGLLTRQLAEGLESPLSRLGKMSLDDRENDDNEEEENDLNPGELERLSSKMKERTNATGTPARRRSKSSDDMKVTAKKKLESTALEKTITIPTIGSAGFRTVLDDALPAVTSEFSSSIENSLSHIYDNRNRNYRVRETTRVVYANDRGGVETVGKAGDVDLGKTWRKKRPSDVEITRSFSTATVSGRSKDPLSGLLYVTVVKVDFVKLALPPTPVLADLYVSNDSNQAASMRAHSFALASSVTLGRKLELDSSTNLTFHLDITVPKLTVTQMATPMMSHNATFSRPLSSSVTPPPSPRKHSGLRSLFSSSPLKRNPRKVASTSSLLSASVASTSTANDVAAAAPPPVPPSGSLRSFLSPSGALARISVRFAEQASKCRMKRNTIQLPFLAPVDRANSSQPIVQGQMTLELLYMPRVKGAEPPPRSTIESVTAALEAADRQLAISHEGLLTQLGGDCGATTRRRIFKLRGTSLLPYSEVTRRATVEIDLTTAVLVIDPQEKAVPATGTGDKNKPAMLTRSSSQDLDDAYPMDNGFKVVFADESEISFFADTAEDKTKWIQVLRDVVARSGKTVKPGGAAPEWAIRYRKLMKAKEAATAR